MNDLAGRRALVTGGSRGIGAATARLFAEHGVHVAIGYRNRRADADALADELRAHGVKAVAHASDIVAPSRGPAMFAPVYASVTTSAMNSNTQSR
jgi:NAD(P)-dependent dehydrogenase (short-subunit alcohol dehydrogenase family)